jgi:hypothetical protein
LALSGSTIYVGGNFTSIGGLPQTGIAAILTTVDVPSGLDPPPLALRLEIRPNPAGRATRIAFALRSQERATLDILDAAGRRVAELLRDQAETAGWHAVELRPSGLPDGLYLVRLRAGGEIVCRKLMLLE